MAIKDELKEEVKKEGGGKDELDALDALEKEAAEYNKVCAEKHLPVLTDLRLGFRNRPNTQSLQAGRVGFTRAAF